MSDAVYHYTSRRHLRRILATGVLRPHTSRP